MSKHRHEPPPMDADKIFAPSESGSLIADLNEDTITPYSVRGLLDIARRKLPPLEYIWNGMPYSDSPVIVIYGAPGRGKSRFVQALARAQILGKDFGGRPTLKRPLRWLYVGSENGIHRTQRESRMFLFGSESLDKTDELDLYEKEWIERRGFSLHDAEQLNTFFRTFTLENPEDGYISVGNENNRERLMRTFQKEQPDIIVWDPWGDVIVEGKELDDGKIRETVQLIRQCEAQAGLPRIPPNVIVAHARMGAREEANANGMEAGNYGKNSKALYSIARYALNIRAATFEENPPIEVICAKNNDGLKPTPLALRLNPHISDYELIPDFDHTAWQRQLDGKKNSANGNGKTTGVTPDAVAGCHKRAIDLVKQSTDDLLTRIDLTNALRAEGFTKAVVEACLAKATINGQELQKTERFRLNARGEAVRDGSRVVYGTPEQIAAYLNKWSPS